MNGENAIKHLFLSYRPSNVAIHVHWMSWCVVLSLQIPKNVENGGGIERSQRPERLNMPDEPSVCDQTLVPKLPSLECGHSCPLDELVRCFIAPNPKKCRKWGWNREISAARAVEQARSTVGMRSDACP